MSSDNTFAALTPDELMQIEALCTRFERSLRAGHCPVIESYCAEVADPLRQDLRRELLLLEHELHNRTTLPFLTDPVKESASPRLPPFTGYDSVTEIAHSHMGVVYRARNQALGRFEALKMIAGPTSVRHLERFRIEAEAAAALDHPAIVPVHGVGMVEGRPFLAIKWIDGRTLTSALPELRADPRLLGKLLVQIARAIHHAHQRGVIHRDLKPGNILLDEAGDPHVVDFGLAKRLDEPDLTHTGAIMGTAPYMAPEQARGERGLTLAVDVYGLGAILYEALTGRPPFIGTDMYAVVLQAQDQTPQPPSVLVPNVDRDLEAICLACLERDPDDRYRSAEDVAEDLERWLNGESISRRQPGVWDWLRQVWISRPVRGRYNWGALLWLGVAILVSDLALFAIVSLHGSALWTWMAFLPCIASQWAMHRDRLVHFGEVHPKERYSIMIGLVFLVFQGVLCFIYLPLNLSASSSAALALFPPLQAGTGMAIFCCGLNWWGRLLPLGLGLMLLSPVLAWFPEWSPLLHAMMVPSALWWWAFCTWRYFVEEPTDALSNGPDPSGMRSPFAE